MIKIDVSNQHFRVSFQSGLSRNVLNMQKTIDCKEAERYILRKNAINTDFANNKPTTIPSILAIEVMDKLKQMSKFFQFWAPNITTYDPASLLLNQKNVCNFCIPETQEVLRDKPAFKTASIFYRKLGSLEVCNYIIEDDFKHGKRSSGHFLAETIHEMLHSMYVHYIYSKYGYGGACEYTKTKYPLKHNFPDGKNIMYSLQSKTFSQAENEIIQSQIGKYATNPVNQYHEVFAETFTKLICDSLSEGNFNPQKNPLESLKNFPREFVEILRKVIYI